MLVFLSPQITFSQDSDTEPTPSPTATPESEETRKLKEQIEKLKLENEKATLEKSLNDTKFPKPTTTPLEGKTEVDENVKIESEMMAYKAMANASDAIVKELKEKGGIQNSANSSLAVYNEKTVTTMLGYNVTTGELILMKNEYGNLLTPPPTSSIKRFNKNRTESLVAGITAITSVVGSFIDLMALFRTDTTIKGATFNIEESALVSEVFRSMKETGRLPNVNLFYPAEFPPGANNSTRYIILERIQELYFTKTRTERLIIQIEEVEGKFTQSKTKKEALEKRKKEIPDELALLEKELEKRKSTYRNFPSAETDTKVKETETKIEALKKELNETIPAELKKVNEALEALTERLDDLYAQILPIVLPEYVLEALNKADLKFTVVNSILGRSYTKVERETYLSIEGFSKQKKDALIAEAQSHSVAALTDDQKAEVVNPLTAAELSAWKKINKAEQSLGRDPNDDEIISLLSESEKIALVGTNPALNDVENAALRKLKKASVEKLKTLNKKFDKFYDDLIKVDEKQGINPLTLYLQTENLKRSLKCDLVADVCPEGSYILQLRVIKAGGNVRIKKNLITNVFTGADITHSGGSIVEFKLYDLNGRILASNVFTVYEYYQKPKSVTKMSNDAYESPSKESMKP